jgi:hypothetical protein
MIQVGRAGKIRSQVHLHYDRAGTGVDQRYGMGRNCAPARAAKTIVKTYAIDGDCTQLGALLVNDVTAVVPRRSRDHRASVLR